MQPSAPPRRQSQSQSQSAATSPALAERFAQVRRHSERLTAPLSAEDCQLQSMPDASPAKWHLAHVSWFFETFVLEKFEAGFTPFDASFRVLFNSYYKGVGDQYPRPQRGLISRPSLAQVLAYRAQVDARVLALLAAPRLRDDRELAQLITLGLQHEQQHQELLLTDIKHALSFNPLHPACEISVWPAASAQPAASAPAEPLRWLRHEGGLVQHGFDAAQDGGFCFDNETPRHTVYLAPFELASSPLTNGEVMAFIAEGGYRQPGLWLSMGWDWARASQRDKPLYWQGEAGDYQHFTLQGLVKVDPSASACHLSYFEADALARWSGARLPTEFEWELAARALPAPLPGQVWEWTQSSYSAYPGYTPWEGLVGEYNGKFMCQQFVLRGGSCATPPGHIRASYRNFFPPEAQWQFTGLRLARDLQGARSNTSTSAA